MEPPHPKSYRETKPWHVPTLLLQANQYFSYVHRSFFRCPQDLKRFPSEKLSRISELIEPWFIFSLVWSVGATGDSSSRISFSHWLRKKMIAENVREGCSQSRPLGPEAGKAPGLHRLLFLLVPGS